MCRSEFDANRYLNQPKPTLRIVQRTQRPAIRPWPLSARLFWISFFALCAWYIV